MKVIKKNGQEENFNPDKIKQAIRKSADRVMVKLTNEQENKVVDLVKECIDKEEISTQELHKQVELALDHVEPMVAHAYRDYRNYKQDFKEMLERVINTSDSLLDGVDHSNANSDSELVSTKRTLIYKALSKEIYKKFFLNTNERKAIEDGYIYIHDIGDRSTTMNCCLADVGNILKGGFDMEGMHYNEPTSIASAINVLCDVTQCSGGMQYGLK